METLPNELLEYISRYCGEYSYFLRQTCRFLRDACTKVSLPALYNLLLKENQSLVSLFPTPPMRILDEVIAKEYVYIYRKLFSVDIVDSSISLAIELESLSILSELEEHISLLTIDIALKKGGVKVLDFLTERKLPLPHDPYYLAVENKVEVLEWLKKKELNITTISCYRAGQKANMQVLRWIKENHYSAIELGYGAAKKGRLDVLDWLREDLQNISCLAAEASVEGRIEVMDWLNRNNFSIESCASNLAAIQGKKEILQWMNENGYSYLLNDYIFYQAALSGNTEAVIYLLEIGCPWNNYYSDKIKDPAIKKLLEERGVL